MRKNRTQLEIRHIGAAVGIEPVLFLGEIVMGDAQPDAACARPPWRNENSRDRHAAWRYATARRRSSAVPACGLRRKGAVAPHRAWPPAPSARRSRRNRRCASALLHHGTRSMRRSTASTSPSSVRKYPRSMVEKTSRLSTTSLRQRPFNTLTAPASIMRFSRA